MRIEFDCKDPAIQKYVTDTFGPRFQLALDHRKTAAGQQALLHRANREMAKEAKRQQWYDYTEVHHEDIEGRMHRTDRLPITDEDGKPVLLVPEVRIVK